MESNSRLCTIAKSLHTCFITYNQRVLSQNLRGYGITWKKCGISSNRLFLASDNFWTLKKKIVECEIFCNLSNCNLHWSWIVQTTLRSHLLRMLRLVRTKPHVQCFRQTTLQIYYLPTNQMCLSSQQTDIVAKRKIKHLSGLANLAKILSILSRLFLVRDWCPLSAWLVAWKLPLIFILESDHNQVLLIHLHLNRYLCFNSFIALTSKADSTSVWLT